MIHLVRHLPTDAAGVCYGWLDVGLTDDSLARLAECADRLAALAPSVVVSSDLRRCRMLAEAVAERCGTPLRLDADWRERHFGRWEGLTWDAIHGADPAAVDRLMEPAFAPPGGESLEWLMARVGAALETLPPNALVVAHGGSIAVARAWIAGVGVEDAVQFIPLPGERVSLQTVF